MAGATSTESTVRRVRRTLDDAGASLVGRRVLALCSGGADSVALVALLGALPRGAAPRSIDVLWLDHALRDDVAAERDAARAAAARIDASFHEWRADLDLRDGAGGLEGAARDWRYARAAELARTLGCDTVCTGHSADDQVEQALLSLVGVTGRAGAPDAMPVVRTLGGDDLRLVRPLLAIPRADLEQACRDADLAWADDPTNDDPDAHARSAVRHRVVPALLDVGPNAGSTLARAAGRARTRDDANRDLAEALLDAWDATHAVGAMAEPGTPARLDMRRLSTLGPAARRDVIAAWLRRAGLGRALTERAVAAVARLAALPGRAACARVDLGGGACVRRDGYDLTISTAPDTEGPTP